MNDHPTPSGYAQTNDGDWIPVYRGIQSYVGGRGYVYRSFAYAIAPGGTRLVFEQDDLTRLARQGRLMKSRPQEVAA